MDSTWTVLANHKLGQIDLHCHFPIMCSICRNNRKPKVVLVTFPIVVEGPVYPTSITSLSEGRFDSGFVMLPTSGVHTVLRRDSYTAL